jgi:hypothetical protein
MDLTENVFLLSESAGLTLSCNGGFILPSYILWENMLPENINIMNVSLKYFNLI